ncbi:RNA polymerase sigma factor [Sporosarcina sp. CAU 1771]
MSSEKWFDDYSDAIYSYILLIVRDLHIAEDLTQETFLKVIANEHRFKGQSSIKTWIFRIAYTTTMSYYRKNKRQMHHLRTSNMDSNIASSPEEIMLLNLQHKQFYVALNSLKPSYAQIIILRKIKGFSTKETATVLSCSEGTVKMRLSRALSSFKRELERGGITSETFI